jgi:hypothetical protein
MTIIETFTEFAMRQMWQGMPAPYTVIERGVSPRSGEVVQRILFANGAESDSFTHWDPPTDPVANRKARLEYLRIVLKKEERDWREFKDACMEQAAFHERFPMGSPPPPANAPDQLREGAFRIQRLRNRVAALEALDVNPREVERKHAAEQLKHERYASFQRLRSAINAASMDMPEPLPNLTPAVDGGLDAAATYFPNTSPSPSVPVLPSGAL